MIATRRSLYAFIFAASLSPLACSDGGAPVDVSVSDHHDDGTDEARLGTVSQPLGANDTVDTAVAQSCTTTSVKGLAVQLVEEIQCMRPNTFSRIDGVPGFALGPAVFPYLQVQAAAELIAVQKARGTTMSINSALRTLPQQYLLYSWYQSGRCGIGLAASPGTSNHEGALAVDVDDNAGWRAAMTSKSFRWLGASDPVHYDFIGGGTVDLHGMSVTAFQRLWNRNHPTDKIAEDGAYGPGTAAKLAQSPANGFATGAICKAAPPDAGTDSGSTGSSPAGVTAVPGATTAGPSPTDPARAPALAPEDTSGNGPQTRPAAESSGCAVGVHARIGTTHESLAGIALGIAAALTMAARRRRQASPRNTP